MKQHTARTIAKHIVAKSIEAGRPATNLRLQRLLYFVQGISYQVNGTPAFIDDFEAWTYGPAIRDVYKKYSSRGTMKLPYEDLDGLDIDPSTKRIVDGVVDGLRHIDTHTLIKVVCEQEPWASCVSTVGTRVIDKSVIEKFFVGLVEQHDV